MFATTVGILLAGVGVRFAMPPTAEVRGESSIDALVSTPTAITCLGRIVPGDGIIDVGAIPPAIVDKLVVQEGSIVAQDDVLAFLERHEEALAAVANARAEYEGAKELLAARIAVAESELASSTVSLERIETVVPLEIRIAREQRDLKQVEHKDADLSFQRAMSLHRSRTMSKEEFEKSELARAVKAQELLISEHSLTLVEKDQEVQRTEAMSVLESRRAKLAEARASVNLAALEARVKLAEARLERTIVRSPTAGCVLRINCFGGESVDGRPLLQIGEVDRAYVVAEVYETDAKHLNIGQKARIVSDALSEELTGRIERISSLIHKNDVLDIDPTAPTDSRVIEAWIRLEDPTTALKLIHLQVDVTIERDA
ncbi:efflux RND transporter periplasmic adaptor subunit [Kolteria novifilia]|uniref:efflux RND transporter periplasmic adaptor subunit n=1 Tax=Kolteria novifilia TaxID=2527975 RepID=UPI003AF3A815